MRGSSTEPALHGAQEQPLPSETTRGEIRSCCSGMSLLELLQKNARDRAAENGPFPSVVLQAFWSPRPRCRWGCLLPRAPLLHLLLLPQCSSLCESVL